MRATVLIPPDLATARLAGRTLADHWALVVSLAGLESDPAPPEAVLQTESIVLVDGRYAALAPEILAALAEKPDGVSLLSPAGDVVALRTGAPGTIRERLAGVTPVYANPLPEAGVRFDTAPAEVEAAVRAWWIARLTTAGVRFVDPGRTIVDTSVEIAAGVVIWPDAILRGTTRIAAGAEIQAGAWLEDTVVGAGALVRPYTVCVGAEIGPGASVGPFAHLRQGAILEADTRVGNFVEVKASTLRRGAKASHLTYLGDADIGAEANIGAGTITCNYDGFGKYRTHIGAGAFVGSNSSLVAPVSIGAGAIVGAGSVVTKDVPAEALYVERAEPRLFEGAAPRLRERNRLRAEKKTG